jgi:plastocyanin
MRRSAQAVLAVLVLFATFGFSLDQTLGSGTAAPAQQQRTPTPQATAQATPQSALEDVSNVSNAAAPPGYSMRMMASGLDFPTSITYSSSGVWVSEAGIGEDGTPEVLRINPDSSTVSILSSEDLPPGALLPPLTDVTYGPGDWLWITHRQLGINGWNVGAISKFQLNNPVGTFTTVITNLPSAGDYYTGEIILTDTGRAYFSQGTATNSGVVGLDSQRVTQWLEQARAFHDFSPVDITLGGVEYTSPNPLTPGDDQAVTSPFAPFGGGPTDQGAIVRGASPLTPQEGIIAGNGALYSFDTMAPNPAATLQLEAWGLRNPYGLSIDPVHTGKLLVTNNGADIRTAPAQGSGQREVIGSRPIANDWDDLFFLDASGGAEFFGWPDIFHNPRTGAPLPVTDPLFCDTGGGPAIPCPAFVISEAFRNILTTQPAFAELEPHSVSNKFDTSMTEAFGYEGDIFVAQTGGALPATGAQRLTGYKVVRVDRETGAVHDFIVNTGTDADEVFDEDGFNKPIDVKFRGEAMLIVDFGVFEPGRQLSEENTGKVWVVTNQRGPTDADGAVMLGGKPANYRGTVRAPSDGQVQMRMGDYYFEPTVVEGAPGQQVRLTLSNVGRLEHNITVDGQNVNRVLAPGQQTEAMVSIPAAGTLRFYCVFHGHLGMAGGLRAAGGGTPSPGAGAASVTPTPQPRGTATPQATRTPTPQATRSSTPRATMTATSSPTPRATPMRTPQGDDDDDDDDDD